MHSVPSSTGRSAASRSAASRSATSRSATGGRLVGTPQRSVGAVVGDILTGVTALAKAEARLAVAEVVSEATDRGRAAARALAIITVGGVLGVLALAALLFTGGAALALIMATWLAALIVAAVVAITAAVALSTGTTHLRRSLKPAESDHPDHTALSTRAKETG